MTDRAFSKIVIKSVNEDQRIIEGIASTPTADRASDVVEPLGAEFKLPMPLLWQHDSRKPIGQVTWAKATKEGIRFRAKIASLDVPGTLKERLDEAWQSVKMSLVRAVSIGFRTLEASYMRDTGGVHFLRWEWVELSLVTIPANEEATISRIKAAFGTGGAIGKHPGASGKLLGTKAVKTFAQLAAEVEEELTPKTTRMQEIMQLSIDEGRDLDESEADEYDGLVEEAADLEKKLKRLRALNKGAATAKAVSGSDPARASAARSGVVYAEPKQVVEEKDKGLGFARLVMAYAFSQKKIQPIDHVIKSRYSHVSREEMAGLLAGARVIDLDQKAQIEGGTTTDSTWASPLVTPTNLLTEFVEYLRPRTIIGRFGVGNIPALRRIPFNVTFPAQTSGGEGYWVGEGKAKPLTRFDFSTTTLGYYKVANIAVLSEELIRLSTPSAEVVVRDALTEALQARMDADFVDPTVTVTAGVRPASITNGATAVVCSGVTAQAVRDDIDSLVTLMVANNIPTENLVLVMRTAQALRLSLMRNSLGGREFPDITMNGGVLEGIPVITSQHVPSGIVVAMVTSEVYFSDDGGVSIAMSREASLEMDDSPSSMVNDGSSPPVSVESTLVSMFQTNSVAIRAERWINWQRRRTYAVVYLSGCGWGGEDVSPIVEI